MKLITKDLASIEHFRLIINDMEYRFDSLNLICDPSCPVILRLGLHTNNVMYTFFLNSKEAKENSKVFFKETELSIAKNFPSVEGYIDCLLEHEQFQILFGSTLLTK